MRCAAGAVSLLAAIALLSWGVARLRAALLPAWSGPPARLAEAVMAIGWVTAVAHVLGSVAWLRPLPVLIAVLLGAVTMGLVGRRFSRVADGAPHNDPSRPRPPTPRGEVMAVAVAAAVVGAQWVAHTAAALNRGMTHPDTLWYHAPFAARFLQHERLSYASETGLEGLATPLHTFLPLNSSMLHAVAALPFGNDVLSPLLNLGWAALALLAAWCIGRRHGGGALAVLGVVVVLGLPAVAGTQPGQGANDVMAAALCFAAVALLLEAGLLPVPTSLAAIAAGIAIGAKLTVAVTIAVLTVGVLVHAVRARRPAVAGLWCGVLALSGGYWFVRNWIVIGNPTPWWSLHIGPLDFDATFTDNAVIAQYLTDGSVWERYFLPGLSQGFGRAWPLLLLLGIGGALWAAARADAVTRLAAIAAIVGAVGWVFTAHSGDLGGAVFVYTLRYLAIVLFLGLTLLAVRLEGAPPGVRRAVWMVLLVLVAVDAMGRQDEGLPAWPSDGMAAGVIAGAAILAAVSFWPRVASRRHRVNRATAGALAVVAVVLVTAGGRLLEQHHLDRRYARAGLAIDRINGVLAEARDERVAVFGTEQLYPMFGNDLSNHVTKVAGPNVGTPEAQCRGWRAVLADGGFTYVVLAHAGGFVERGPEPEWLGTDPAARLVVTDGPSALYRIDGRLDPSGCDSGTVRP